MTIWIVGLLFVLGIGLGMACCCDGVCLDCDGDTIQGSTVAITYAGVVQSGGSNEYCTGSATTCESGWNGTHMLPYNNGAETESCQWVFSDDTYLDVPCEIRLVFAVFSSGVAELTTYSDTTTDVGGAYFTYDNGEILGCDFDFNLSLDSTNPGDGTCDHSAATANAATV